VTIVQPSAINISAILDDADCSGDNSGNINTSVSGATPGYSYSWIGPNGFSATIPDINNISAGEYILEVTDANGCIRADTFSIGEPLDLISTISTSDYNGYGVSCFGLDNGSVNLTVNQNTGTAPFTYSWSPGGQTNMNLSNRIAGQYTVTITDANNCTYTDVATITEPTQLLVFPVVSSDYNGAHISCTGYSDGEAIITPSGGVQPYTVFWGNNSSTANTISNLSAGNYYVTITDDNGCIDTGSVDLIDPPVLLVGLNIRDSLSYNVSCFGICDGWAEAIPNGGTGNYNYSWNDANSQTTAMAQGLCAGTLYTITVTDANGCVESSTTDTFTQPNAFEAQVTTTDYYGPEKPPLNVHFADSTYLSTSHPMLFTWLWPDGGIEPFSWEYGDPGMNISYSFTDIGENKVNLIVLNRTTGCTDTVDFVIDVQGLEKINNVFSPNGDGVNDVFAFENHGMDILSVMIFNRWGQKVFETDVSSAQWNGENLKGNEELAGTYFYVLTAQGKDGYRYEEKGALILIRE
jgi:gliding motility-associated-like protein